MESYIELKILRTLNNQFLAEQLVTLEEFKNMFGKTLDKPYQITK